MSEDKRIGGILEPGQIIRPEVTIRLAEQLIRDNFGYAVKKITELNSYDDKNFYVEAVRVRNGLEDGERKKFVFKILNSMDSRKQHFAAENAAMVLLRKTLKFMHSQL